MTRLSEFMRRAFGEFLGVPTLVIGGFLLVTALMYALDRSDLAILQGIRDAMGGLVFSTPEATRSLLGTLAASLVTLTSITFSLLLIALQQAAASMTHAIIDQFLRRRSNQLFFGFFVGLALYALVILSTTGPDFNPVLSASLALVLGMLSLFLLIVLIYATIHQVRPAVVVEAIHDHTLAARERQLRMLGRTRRRPMRADAPTPITADSDGFVVAINLDAIADALDPYAEAELEVHRRIGSYVSFGDVLADARGVAFDDTARTTVRDAFTLDRVRDLARDPAFGIEELVNIAWTSISTSKQSPGPGQLVIFALRDLLARWAQPAELPEGDAAGKPVAVVYHDTVVDEVLDALELMAVVSSESMQAQNLTDVVDSLALLHGRLPAAIQERVADVAMRILAGLGDHVLTAPLEAALGRLTEALTTSHPLEAVAVLRATETLRSTNGVLNSRATRVPTG